MLNFKISNLEAEFLNIVRLPAKSLVLKSGENVKAQVVDVLPNGGVILRFKGQLVEVQSEIPLQKGSQLLLKILPGTDRNNIKLQLLSVLSKSTTENIEKLIKNFKFEPMSFNFKSQLISNSISENFISSFKFDVSKFENVVKNTGVLFETKIKKGLDYKNDLKFKLLTLFNDDEIENTDKEKIKALIKDIQQYQYISKITDAFWTFLPFISDDIEKADFIYKKINRDGKKFHFIIIPVNLKEIGKLYITIVNFDKNLHIGFSSENKEFLSFLKKDIKELKEKLGNEFIIDFSFLEKEFNIEEIVKTKFESIFNMKA